MVERAIFDLRLEVEGETRKDVYAAVALALEAVRSAQLDGVNARYTQLRPASRSRTFVATMVPGRSWSKAEIRSLAEQLEEDDG